MQALLPVWAELHGGRRHLEVGRSVRQALYLCAITIALGMTALLLPGPLLRWTEVPLALQVEVENYLAVLALALAPSLLFRMYSTLNQSLGKPLLITWLQIGSLCVKVPLSIWFAFGGWGLEARGAVGCAVATLVVNYAMLGLALWLLRTQDLYRPYGIWCKIERPDWTRIRAFARLGIPGGLAIMVEVTSFTLMALFIARQGTVASASHQIASNLAAVLYMTPLSLAIATSARVSYWLGAGQPQRARQAIGTGLQMTMLLAMTLSLSVWLSRETLASLYASQPAVVTAASSLLAWVALYHLADAPQAVCIFILRSYRVALAPLVVYSVLLWGLGLAGGYALAYRGVGSTPAMGTPVAFWAASMAALALVAVIFAAMVWRVAHRRTPPVRHSA
jgi:MATE family multidrug resistance protein